jgi:type I restriction enzyme, R subunit
MSDTPSIDKKSLSERDICTKFLTPALAATGWDIQTQILEQFTICAGQIQVRGSKAKRGERRFADYALFYKPGLKIGVLEAKDNKHSLGAGMPQALDYAERMNVPFAFSSNGDAFLFHDKTVTDGPVESQLALDQFPSPEELWEKYCNWKHLTNEPRRLVEQDYHTDGSGKNPRYYQLNAINNSIEAVANGDDRILLVMATGQARHTQHSRSFGGCGSRERRNASYFWPIAMRLSIKLRPTISSRLERQ